MFSIRNNSLYAYTCIKVESIFWDLHEMNVNLQKMASMQYANKRIHITCSSFIQSNIPQFCYGQHRVLPAPQTEIWSGHQTRDCLSSWVASAFWDVGDMAHSLVDCRIGPVLPSLSVWQKRMVLFCLNAYQKGYNTELHFHIICPDTKLQLLLNLHNIWTGLTSIWHIMYTHFNDFIWESSSPPVNRDSIKSAVSVTGAMTGTP